MPEKKKKKRDDWTGLAIPAGIFLGMGIGFLYNVLVPGLFIGLGIGFLTTLILKALKRG